MFSSKHDGDKRRLRRSKLMLWMSVTSPEAKCHVISNCRDASINNVLIMLIG